MPYDESQVNQRIEKIGGRASGLTDIERKIVAAYGFVIPTNEKAKKIEFPDGILYADFDFIIPAGVPTKPLVLGQDSLTNHGKETATLHGSVTKTVEDSETLSWDVRFGTAVEQAVKYGPPTGVGGSTKVTVSVEAGVGGQVTKTSSVAWEKGVDVPVPAHHEQVVKFVVQERRINRVPWTARLMPQGKGKLTLESFLLNYELWSEPGFKGMCLRGTTESKSGIKWAERKRFSHDKSGKRKDGLPTLVGRVRSVRINGGKATVHKHHGWCHHRRTVFGELREFGGRANSWMFYPEKKTRTVVLDFAKAFPAADSGIPVHGHYSSVQASEGKWRILKPIPLCDTGDDRACEDD